MKIAVFDFDGTITTRDTFLEFIKFSKGPLKFWLGFLILSPVILLLKSGILNNSKAKQIVFSFFFRGMPLSRFDSFCSDFTPCIDRILVKDALAAIKAHQNEGNTVIVISASIENWIKPWAELKGIHNVLATQPGVDSQGCLTGNFLTANCYGEEKKKRLLQAYPGRTGYTLYVYGDSHGDKSLMDFADFSYYRRFA